MTNKRRGKGSARPARDRQSGSVPAASPTVVVVSSNIARSTVDSIAAAPCAAVALLIAGVGAFWSGLSNPFLGDDLFQIVDSPPVQSLANVGSFFTGGTFYTGQPKLTGINFRPVMMTLYSVLYSAFGPNPTPFRVLALGLCVMSSMLLYLFLRYDLSPGLALALSLVFLLHPANSEIVYSIARLGDALFLFFGILALWLLRRFSAPWVPVPVVACLMLSMLSKETGILFVAMAFALVLSRGRSWRSAFMSLLPLMTTILVPLLGYVLLKVNAVGLNTNPYNAPIDDLDIWGRLLTLPSALLFYLTKLVYPVPLASGYYWVHPTFSLVDFVLPLVIDSAVVALVIRTGRSVRRRGTAAQCRMFWFYAAWTVIGFLAHLQLVPLDMTVSETWLYFPMAGILGMIGIAATAFAPSIRLDRRALMAAGAGLVVLLGVRTALRGGDWADALTLAQHDLAVSPDDYQAHVAIVYPLLQQGRYAEAKSHAYVAVGEYRSGLSDNILGLALLESGDYGRAREAFLKALALQDSSFIWDNLGLTTVFSGNLASNRPILVTALRTYPQDGKLWLDLAIIDQRGGKNDEAKQAISNAYQLGAAGTITYNQVMNNQTLTLPSRPGLEK